jgi:mycofactocin system glycosyltransferase
MRATRTCGPERTSGVSSPSTRATYRVCPGTEVLPGGRILLGGEPPRLIRLSDSGAELLGAVLSDGHPGELGERELRLLDHLVGAGLLHKTPPPLFDALDVTVVIPVRQPAPFLGELVSLLAGEKGLLVVVVDDASPDAGAATRDTVGARASVVVRESRGGPGAARNAAFVTTTFVAYLDADTVLETADPLGWLRLCLSHLADDAVGLVAPRVKSFPGTSGLARYEETDSPLDLGEVPGEVGAFRRLSYVPATALVGRSSALAELGGFDEALSYGEDVDLVRRLEKAGWKVRYEPAAVVFHRPRKSLFSLSRQRFFYGTAAGPLEARHPGTVPPFAASPSAFVAAAGLVAGGSALAGGRARLSAAWLGAAGLSFLVTSRRLSAKLERAGCPGASKLAARLVFRADHAAAGALLRAFRRAWWPLGLLLVSKKRRRRPLFALAAAAIGHGRLAVLRTRWHTTPTGERLAALCSEVAYGLVDDVSYSAGLWAGAVRTGSLSALWPRVVRSEQTDRRETKDPLG